MDFIMVYVVSCSDKSGLPDNNVTRPAIRERFILHPDITQVPNWVMILTETRINWDGLMSSAVQLDPHTNRMVITAAFESIIRSPDSWIVPALAFDIFPGLSDEQTP